jgi:hypothetical protein
VVLAGGIVHTVGTGKARKVARRYIRSLEGDRRIATGQRRHQNRRATLREKLVKIGDKVVPHAKYMSFQLAEVAVSRRTRSRVEVARS